MTYNGQVGVEASHSSNITIQDNDISNNNTGNYNVSQEAAGLKGTNVSNVTVKKTGSPTTPPTRSGSTRARPTSWSQPTRSCATSATRSTSS